MRIDPLDFSQARTAPVSVVCGLEALDPTACIVYLGDAAWLVGKMRPNALVRADACAMLDHWTTNLREGKRLSPQGRQRVRFAQLALLGVRPVQQYRIIGSPDSRIVWDFERSRWLWLHVTENEVTRQLDSTERADASRDALANPDLAKDAWRYAFTTSHMPSASLTPDIGPKAGWVRHPIVKAS